MSRLSKCVGVAGGLTFEETVARGEAALATMSGEAKTNLGANLEQLQRLAREAAHGNGKDQLLAIQHTATEIQSISGMFGLSRLSEAARLLSELTMELEQSEKAPPQVMLLFADGLTSIFKEGEADADELISTLGVLSSRVIAGTLS